MKPVSFQYFVPSELAEVLELLQQYGDDAKVLAGGQSLMPMMNMRLVRPKVVIDINRVPDLDHISLTAHAGLNLGFLLGLARKIAEVRVAQQDEAQLQCFILLSNAVVRAN